MVASIILEAAGSNAVKKLRLKKLSNGLPFMINSGELPNDQCYLEYPNGTIKLVKISKSTHDFIMIKELSQKESASIRHKYHLT